MEEHQHFLLHKPYGYLSQFITNQKGKKKKMLGELYNFPEGVMAVGRLDEKSEGLLLLTTNGKISDFITTRGNVEKEYYVQVDGIISKKEIKQLKNGVEISIEGKKYITKPCKASLISAPNFPERTKKIRDDRHGPTSWISITLNEGKFRQVRKMTAVVGFPTLRLIRIRIGNIKLNKLTVGEVKKVTQLIQ